MMDDANHWLTTGKYTEKPHDKTGAMALHIAAAKGYTTVIKSVLNTDIYLILRAILVVHLQQKSLLKLVIEPVIALLDVCLFVWTVTFAVDALWHRYLDVGSA